MFQCGTCNKTFANKQVLLRHNASESHIQRVSTIDVFFACDCGRSFQHRSGLYRHRKYCDGTTVNETTIILPSIEERKNTATQTPPSMLSNTPQIQSQLDTQNELIHSMQKEITSLTKRLDSNLREKRHKLPASIRNEIAERQLYHCGACKNDLGAHYHIDHIVARQFGGDNCLENLMALCYECHVAKSVKETQRKTQIREAVQRILEDNE
jgi:5-methylcytosine-specific restriction endonuclease McrA